ncbi:hydroxyethylthiazole kinase [Nevskia soli]|uniref:hydroxyethylthiazole kinase n=1 Tax=Nevskia soli TaxID=418856 RepID=UPI000690EFF4|nr:hydroxyethylthiazole kinase [Nevskia soli]
MDKSTANPTAGTLPPGALLERVRAQSPLVHCITNYVAMNFAANVLLAAGASPAMVHSEKETAEFAGISGALTINIGTLSDHWLTGMELAADAARAANKPWVLDPVAHHATSYRRNAIARLLALKPTVIRGNASEIIALDGGTSTASGVDARDSVELAAGAAVNVARKHATVVAVTGEADFVTDGHQSVRISGGSHYMPMVTAMGCALTGLVGAFAAVAPASPLDAAIAALACFAVAGEQAAVQAEGPGSFSWRFLDALAALTPQSLTGRQRLARA